MLKEQVREGSRVRAGSDLGKTSISSSKDQRVEAGFSRRLRTIVQ